MTQSIFVGTWRLVSYEVKLENGQVIYPFGEEPVGYLMYTEQGYMSVTMMSANRPPFASENTRKASKEEILAAAETFLAYCGKYEVLEDKVVHYPEVSGVPNWIGVRLERTFKITGNRLFLSTLPSSKGDMPATSSHLVWERV
ncbi:MAG: hypothetical protein DRR19_09720 [Candidatus Parabeggiatoa sp. nov. 1]|nr:MAG: hypothetical protein DRR19_09720 [Gammaproteobacteria bacterium]